MEAHLESIRAQCERIVTCKFSGVTWGKSLKKIVVVEPWGPFGHVDANTYGGASALSSVLHILNFVQCPVSLVHSMTRASHRAYRGWSRCWRKGPLKGFTWTISSRATARRTSYGGLPLPLPLKRANMKTVRILQLLYHGGCVVWRFLVTVEKPTTKKSSRLPRRRTRECEFLLYLCVTVGATPALTVSVKLQGHRAHP